MSFHFIIIIILFDVVCVDDDNPKKVFDELN